MGKSSCPGLARVADCIHKVSCAKLVPGCAETVDWLAAIFAVHYKLQTIDRAVVSRAIGWCTCECRHFDKPQVCRMMARGSSHKPSNGHRVVLQNNPSACLCTVPTAGCSPMLCMLPARLVPYSRGWSAAQQRPARRLSSMGQQPHAVQATHASQPAIQPSATSGPAPTT